MKNRVKVFIDGKGFTLLGEESEEHIRAVADYIDAKLQEMRGKTAGFSDSGLAYVLTALNVADDYFKEKARAAELEGRLLGLTARIQELTHRAEAAEQAKAEKE